jgi:hypothetical protein
VETVIVGRNDYAVEVVVDEEFGYVEVMMVVGVVADGGFGQAELPASALTDEEY